MGEKYDELLEEAKSLSIPVNSGIYKPKTDAWSELNITEWELHRRIKEEQRHRREHRLWGVAVISAIFAILSALASWWPVIGAYGAGK